jgi:hypothetical protein
MDNLLQIKTDVSYAALQNFPNTNYKVWYVQLGTSSWKALIIDADTKRKLCESLQQKTPEESFQNLKEILEEKYFQQTLGI